MARRRAVERRWVAWAALPVLVWLALSVRSAVRAVVDHRDRVPPVAAPAGRAGAEDHFPGAASLYAAGAPRIAQASPAPGSTGTVAPPPEPVGAVAAALLPDTVVSARPFTFGHAAALDRGRALECLAAAVYHEAGNQGDDGERAVAQVVLNRVRHPAFPATVCGVVYQGSEHAGCQFSFACDGSMARPMSRAGWTRALRIAADALAGQVFAPVGLATHYHTYAVTPAWNRALVMTDTVGTHFFHRWKGYWGTPAAFRQRWSGHEPAPGPRALPDLATPALPSEPEPMVAAPGPVPTGPTLPSHIDTRRPIIGDRIDTLPDSQVLDRWKDSGRPLR